MQVSGTVQAILTLVAVKQGFGKSNLLLNAQSIEQIDQVRVPIALIQYRWCLTRARRFALLLLLVRVLFV